MCVFFAELVWRMFWFSGFSMGEEKRCCSDAMEIVCRESQDGGNLVHLLPSSFPPKILLLICFHHEFVTIYHCRSQREVNDNQSSYGYCVD